MQPRFSRLWTAIVVLATILLIFPATAAAAEPAIRADLGGKPIPLVEVGSWYCHDFDFPLIHCFRSAAALDAAVSNLGYEPLTIGAEASTSVGATSPSVVLAVSYVRVFVDANYSGNSAYFSVNYSNLGLIGWNDKISSFAALNSASGRFFEHNNYAGFVYGFCCNSQVSYVGNSYNDRFSSVSQT